MTKKRLIIIFILFLLSIFLFINIFSSQTISPLFFGMVNGDKKAAAQYLEKIKTQSQFKDELEYYKKIHGIEIERMVFKDEKIREEKIAYYESILKKNPKSRDLLYGLYLLYKSSGENEKAQEYLGKAKEIDPNIKN